MHFHEDLRQLLLVVVVVECASCCKHAPSAPGVRCSLLQICTQCRNTLNNLNLAGLGLTGSVTRHGHRLYTAHVQWYHTMARESHMCPRNKVKPLISAQAGFSHTAAASMRRLASAHHPAGAVSQTTMHIPHHMWDILLPQYQPSRQWFNSNVPQAAVV